MQMNEKPGSCIYARTIIQLWPVGVRGGIATVVTVTCLLIAGWMIKTPSQLSTEISKAPLAKWERQLITGNEQPHTLNLFPVDVPVNV